MKKIAVMLPIGYRGGSLRAAKSIAKGIAFQTHKQNADIQVVFSYAKEGKYNLHLEFDDLIAAGIQLRETVWEVCSKSTLSALATLVGIDKTNLEYEQYCVPTDGANDFFDCDFWLIVSDRLPAPLFPMRKYACLIFDYIQRYVPEIFGDNSLLWETQVANLFYTVQKSSKVFVTTPSTRADMISYAGVDEARIQLLEMEFHPIESRDTQIGSSLPADYVLWATNAASHKNHVNALESFEIYTQELKGRLHLVLTGVGTRYLDPRNKFPNEDPMLQPPQIQYFREKIRQNPKLQNKVHILGNVSDSMFAGLIKTARFLWHPAIYDNGTFSVVEAAYLGTPSLSARYPAMEYINQKFDLNLQFFDPLNQGSAAEALMNMETQAKLIRLPEQSNLLQRDWKALSLERYQAILELVS